jgi:ribosomal protein S18 acetylase RimI-like enzyme
MSGSVTTPALSVARLDARHVDAVAAIHRAAFPGFFLSQLGDAFLRLYYRQFTAASDTIAYTASQHGQPIAFVAGAVDPSGFYRRLFARRWLSFGVAALPAVLRDPRRLRRVLRGATHARENPAGSSVAGLFSLAVAPASQGVGVGRALVRAFLDDAAARCCREIRLTTDAAANDAVNAFYHSCGFERRTTFRTPEGREMHEYRYVL